MAHPTAQGIDVAGQPSALEHPFVLVLVHNHMWEDLIYTPHIAQHCPPAFIHQFLAVILPFKIIENHEEFSQNIIQLFAFKLLLVYAVAEPPGESIPQHQEVLPLDAMDCS